MPQSKINMGLKEPSYLQQILFSRCLFLTIQATLSPEIDLIASRSYRGIGMSKKRFEKLKEI